MYSTKHAGRAYLGGYKAVSNDPVSVFVPRCASRWRADASRFLDTSGGDPRPALAQALIDALGERQGGMKGVSAGTIFMYSPYERTQLKNLAEAVPQHRAAIERIIGRLVDLHPIVRDNHYYPAQEGSWSIKNVLPAMFGNDDAELSYAQLGAAGKVADGGAATSAYLEAIEATTTPERKAQIHAELLAYCKLDTLAMVRVWERLARLSC